MNGNWLQNIILARKTKFEFHDGWKWLTLALFILIIKVTNATIITAFDDSYGSEILYQDRNIIVTDKGVYSTRTKKLIIFQEAPNWEEEDFFTQQEKYCEKDTK